MSAYPGPDVRKVQRTGVASSLRRLAQPAMVGTVIGKYRIVGSLGRGATGVVYRAVDESLGRDVAIKILSSEVTESDLLKRFRTEATALAKLNHPGIATIYELFTSGSDLLMVMEFVAGQTLEQLSEREGPMAPARASYFVDGILSALEQAHRVGIVHRDIKPANVMITHAGGVKIMDFGIAQVRGVEHFTVDGCLMGTPAYIAPEHVRGEHVDERADLYAAGVIFYRLLTGRLPFNADSTVVMLQKHISERPTALRAHRADLPPWCDAIVQRAMAKRPARRFQTASEFRTALRRSGAAPGASRAGRAGIADARGVLAAARPRQLTLVLSRNAAKAIRRRARTSRWPGAVATIGLAASLVLLADGTGRRPLPPRPTAPPPQKVIVPAAAAVTVPAPVKIERPRKPPAVPVKVERAPDPAPVAVRPARKAYPDLAFVTKGLVGSGREQRMRDVRLALAENSIIVSDDETRQRLQVVPYDDLSGITYSYARDPMWSSSDGPTRIVRTSGGFSRVLGFSGKRHWISLMTRTDRQFIILRVTDSQVSGVLAALEQRTGRTPQLLEARNGAD